MTDYKDELTKNLSYANRAESIADRANILSCNADARMREVEREGHYEIRYLGGGDIKDYEYRRNYRKHFTEPGGMTFRRDTVLIPDY